MSKKGVVLALVLLLFLIPAAERVERGGWVYSQIVGFDCERCFKDVEELTEMGPRLTGSEQEREAAAYIKEKFEEANLSNVGIEEYNLTCFEVKKANLSVLYKGAGVQKKGETLEHGKDFALMAYSGSTDGPECFEVVFVGNGEVGDYEELDVRNKAVLVRTRGLFGEQLLQAMEHGASACLIHNTHFSQKRDYRPISGATVLQDWSGRLIPFPDANPDPIPSLMVSYQVGKDLRQAIENSRIDPIIRLDVDSSIFEGSLSIVTGEILGSADPEEFVLVGAHHDSVYLSPGAVDNAAGCATLIELARQLSKFAPRKTIKFATWGGEEEGMFGSAKWTDAHGEEVGNLIAYFNIDQNNINLERGNSIWFISNNGELLNLLELIHKHMVRFYPEIEGYKIYFDWKLGATSGDEIPFIQKLKKVISVYGSGTLNWEYHTPLDKIDYVYPESLAITGYLLGPLILWLTN
jgi:aminopeptidase YwaD